MNRRWIALLAIAVLAVVPIAIGATVDVFAIDIQSRVAARTHTIERALAPPIALVAPDLHRGPPATS